MKGNQFAVIGLGRFGSNLAKELIRQGYEVMGIDKRAALVDELSDQLTHAVTADSTDEDHLKSLGIRNFDCVVVAIGDNLQASTLTAILLKELGVKTVVAKALSELHGKVLQKIGVERVIFPERDMAIRVANQLVTPNLLDYIELSKDYTIAEISVPEHISGKTLRDLDTRAEYGCSVVAINSKSGVTIAPSAADVLREQDILVLIGTNSQIERFEEEVIQES